METQDVTLHQQILLPCLEDVHLIKLSEDPLVTAKELFDKCKNVIRISSNVLANKELQLINEIGVKLLENLDSLCSPSDEKKRLIKEVNLLCDHIEDLVKRNNENKDLRCQICFVQCNTDIQLIEHIKQHSSQTCEQPHQNCVQCQDPFIFSSETNLCINCTHTNVDATADNSPKRKTVKNSGLRWIK